MQDLDIQTVIILYYTELLLNCDLLPGVKYLGATRCARLTDTAASIVILDAISVAGYLFYTNILIYMYALNNLATSAFYKERLQH